MNAHERIESLREASGGALVINHTLCKNKLITQKVSISMSNNYSAEMTRPNVMASIQSIGMALKCMIIVS